MEPDEIWQTIIKADELLKYATAERSAQRHEQAKVLLEQALAAAEDAGNQQLATQARTRLADLGEPDA
jgi:hypothetical protein